MGRIAKSNASRRLNLDMAEAVRERLEELRDQTQADSLTEVIRRALAVYDFLWAEKRKGAKLMLKTKDNEREFVLL